MKCLLGTDAALSPVATAVNAALGYPKKGSHIGGGIHVNMPPTWDGTGPTPPGWTSKHQALFENGLADACYPLDDATVAAVAASATAQAADKSLVASVVASRIDVPDPSNGNTRGVVLSASAMLAEELP